MANTNTRRAGGKILKEPSKWIDRLASYKPFGSIDDILSGATRTSNTLFKKIMNAKATRIALVGLREYTELVSEVIVEMAFDNLLTLDQESRPLGGSSTFIMTMTLSVLTMGALSSLGSRGLKSSKLDWSSKSGKLRGAMIGISVSLAISQLVMRLPVYMSVMG